MGETHQPPVGRASARHLNRPHERRKARCARETRRASAGPSRGTALCHPRALLVLWRGVAGIKRAAPPFHAPSPGPALALLAVEKRHLELLLGAETARFYRSNANV